MCGAPAVVAINRVCWQTRQGFLPTTAWGLPVDGNWLGPVAMLFIAQVDVSQADGFLVSNKPSVSCAHKTQRNG